MIYFTKSRVENNATAQENVARLEKKWISDIGGFEKLSVQNFQNGASARRYIYFQL